MPIERVAGSQAEEWKKVSSKIVFGAKRYDIVSTDFLRPGDQEWKDVCIKKEPDCVGILAITLDQKIVMVRHFRPGPGKILLELPAGDVDKGEDPLLAATRELYEETGFYSEDVVLTGSSYRDAYSTGTFFSVIIKNCIFEGIPGSHKALPGLREIITVSIEEFREILENERMTNSEAGFRGLKYLDLL